jgi:hypothetical protein
LNLEAEYALHWAAGRQEMFLAYQSRCVTTSG